VVTASSAEIFQCYGCNRLKSHVYFCQFCEAIDYSWWNSVESWHHGYWSIRLWSWSSATLTYKAVHAGWPLKSSASSKQGHYVSTSTVLLHRPHASSDYYPNSITFCCINTDNFSLV